jgi:hypothetical protein
MATDHIRYDVLAQEALRGVVRTVLQDAAKNGLPGEHHFYISFDPRADGVTISERLRAQYPEEMTVILQHQFWDLVVKDDHFEVGLSFGGIPERLVIPFEAIKGFFDPSVQFGLQFETIAEGEMVTQDTGDEKPRSLPVAANPDQSGPVVVPDPSPAGEAKTEAKPEAEIVRLDKFRKK